MNERHFLFGTVRGRRIYGGTNVLMLVRAELGRNGISIRARRRKDEKQPRFHGNLHQLVSARV